MMQEGEELRLQIPAEILEEAGIECGTDVMLVVEDNKLIISAV